MKRVGAFLMTKKGFLVLRSIIEEGYVSQIGYVVGAKDPNVVKDFSSEIRELCTQNKIPYFEKKDMGYKRLDVTYILAISWRWLISGLNDQPLIVLHDSLLPRYRGFAPLANALINEEKEVGVTALYATNEYDRGPIIGQSKLRLEYPIKISSAIDLISNCYVELVLGIFHKINLNEHIEANPQNEENATYSLWRDEEDYRIDWRKSSKEIQRFIDALGDPYLGASTYVKDKKIRIYDVSIVPDVNLENRDVGKVVFMEKGKPIVVCGKGLLKIENARSDDSNEPLLPLKNFRTKFY